MQQETTEGMNSLQTGLPYICMLTVTALLQIVPYCAPSGPQASSVTVRTRQPYHHYNHHPSTISSRPSTGWTPLTYPNPMYDPTHCRVTGSYGSVKICDPDSLLTDQALAEISQIMKQFNSREVDLCSPLNDDQYALAINYNTNLDAGTGADTSTETTATTANDDESSAEPGLGNFLRGKRDQREQEANETHAKVQVAVAVMRKMDIRAILKLAQYYEFEDISDAEDEAARYFAAYLRDVWDVGDGSCKSSGVLIFLSVDDSICYISPGRAIQPILSGWRLEDVIDNSKPLLRHGQFRWAIEQMITEMEHFLGLGPPMMHEWMLDFFKRYGLITIITIAMFCYAAWNEHVDRYNKRLLYDVKSKMSTNELKKARSLQRDFREHRCPICLCNYQPATKEDADLEDGFILGVPTVGSDGLTLKLLRCGHTFDESCWKQWIMSGKGDVSKCPMCRQDVRGPLFDSWQTRSVGTLNEQRALNNFGTQTTYGTNTRNDLEFDAHLDQSQEGIETSLSPGGVSVISFGRERDAVVLDSSNSSDEQENASDIRHMIHL